MRFHALVLSLAVGLAVVSAPAATVGNFVWLDTNRNGIQDQFEPGFDGVLLELLNCPANTLLDSDTSNGGGIYGFTGTYESPVALRVRVPAGFALTAANAGSEAVDSDADPATGLTPCIPFDCADANSATCLQDDWDIGIVRVGPGPGVRSPGFWKNHLAAWPVSVLTIGGKTYSAAEANSIMSNGDDKSLTLFRSVVAARLNVLMGNEASCVLETLWHAEQWLEANPVGSNVEASSAAWKAGEPLHLTLDSYNNGNLCAPKSTGGNFASVDIRDGDREEDGVRLRLIGEPGQIFTIQQSTNLVNWIALTNVTNYFAVREFVAEKLPSAPNTFYRVVVVPGAGNAVNVFGTFLELENDESVPLLPIVYDGDLVIRGNNNVVSGAGPGRTVIAGDVLITGNGNEIRDLTVLGTVTFKGNENVLRNVDYQSGVIDTGNENNRF